MVARGDDTDDDEPMTKKRRLVVSDDDDSDEATPTTQATPTARPSCQYYSLSLSKYVSKTWIYTAHLVRRALSARWRFSNDMCYINLCFTLLTYLLCHVSFIYSMHRASDIRLVTVEGFGCYVDLYWMQLTSPYVTTHACRTTGPAFSPVSRHSTVLQ